MHAAAATTKCSKRLCGLILFSLIAGCQYEAALTSGYEGTVSPAYIKFNPKYEFRRVGIVVNTDHATGGLSPHEVYGWRSFHGSLRLPPDMTGCDAVARAIRRALNRALDAPCNDELEVDRKRAFGQPFCGMFRYEQHEMRGRVYVWLFPDESETQVNYAILLHEERATRQFR